MLVISLASVLLTVPALALPKADPEDCCSLSEAKLPLPSNQTALTAPTGAPSFVAVAVGVQNYTCNSTSLTYSNVGAVAELFDISCLSGSPEFNKIQNDAFKIWNNSASSVRPQQVIKKLGHDLPVLGQHYYVPNPNITTGSPAISPKWDFTSGAENGDAEAYVIGAKVASLPAPSGKNDIDWVQLKKVEGALADAIYRVDTKGGQPPASCTAGAPLLSVKYTAQYWLFGGSVIS